MIRRAGPSLEGPLGRSLAFAAGSALVIAARVFDRGEPFHDRTWTLVALAGLGAFLGGAPVFLALATSRGRRLGPATRLLLGGFLCSAGFLAATYLVFGVHLKFLSDLEELDFRSPEFSFGELHVVGRMIDALGLFVVTGQRYFLVWPIAAVALLGAWLAARPYGAGRAVGQPKGSGQTGRPDPLPFAGERGSRAKRENRERGRAR